MAEAGREELHQQLRAAETLHKAARQAGRAGVWMPDALGRNYPDPGLELAWFRVLPSQVLSVGPRAGTVRRHHVGGSIVERPVKAPARTATFHEPASIRTLRHGSATHLIPNGIDIRQTREHLGHANGETTMIYTHVVKELRKPPGPPDGLLPLL